MPHSITVQECQPRSVWIKIVGSAATLSLLFFLLYWNMSDPLVGSIFQLIAFIIFVVVVMGSLNLLNKPLYATLSLENNLLDIVLKENQRTLMHEKYSCSDIRNISRTRQGKSSLDSIIMPESLTLIATDTRSETYYLFRFSGRLLFFSPDDINQLMHFIQQYKVTSED